MCRKRLIAMVEICRVVVEKKEKNLIDEVKIKVIINLSQWIALLFRKNKINSG